VLIYSDVPGLSEKDKKIRKEERMRGREREKHSIKGLQSK
jgi:hypothetical protein